MIKPIIDNILIKAGELFWRLLIIIIASNTADCQIDNVFNLPDDCYVKKNEKVYVHLKKSVYVSGETIQYSAYVVNASSLKLSSLSKVLYFEISDSKNRSVLNWISPINNGIAYGSVDLPDSLLTGLYYLKVFTNWMRNTSPGFYNIKKIVITNLTDNIKDKMYLAIMDIDTLHDILFFPEGGNLVEGLESMVGFRIMSRYITKIPSFGIIKEVNNEIVDTFFINKSGWGKFKLRPGEGKTYMAEVKLLTGEVISESLPEIKRHGYVLTYKNNAYSSNRLIVKSNTDKSNYSELLRLVVMSKGEQVKDTSIHIDQGKGQILFASDELPQGICKAVITDLSDKIVCERLFYNATEFAAGIKFYDHENNFHKREKVRLEFEMENLSGDETVYLSVSVSEQTPFADMAGDDIFTYLYFYADIFNPVIPNYSESLSLDRINDLLLVTLPQHYAWNNQTSTVPPCEHIMEDQGYVLSGKVENRFTKTPLVNSLVILSVLDSIVKLKYCYTDLSGRFFFLLNTSHFNKDLYIQLGDYNESDNISWEIDKKNPPARDFYEILYPWNYSAQQHLEYCRKVVLAKNIYINKELDKDTSIILVKNLRARNFYGQPNQTVNPEEYSEIPGFKEISDNILYGVKFKRKQEAYSIHLFNRETFTLLEEEGTVFLNGIPFHDLAYISLLGSKDIQKIDIINTQYFYGDLAFYGIVSILTKDKKIPDSYCNGSVYKYRNQVQLAGLKDKIRHSDPFQHDKTDFPDFRQNLYWNPLIKKKSTDKVIIEFYTSDLLTTYEINIQGITENGNPIRYLKTFNVK